MAGDVDRAGAVDDHRGDLLGIVAATEIGGEAEHRIDDQRPPRVAPADVEGDEGTARLGQDAVSAGHAASCAILGDFKSVRPAVDHLPTGDGDAQIAGRVDAYRACAVVTHLDPLGVCA